jgi:hypothetical protein
MYERIMEGRDRVLASLDTAEDATRHPARGAKA